MGNVTVDNSSNNSTPERVGGLVGCTYLKGDVENSYSAGQVTVNNVDYVGGLVGYVGSGNKKGSVDDSFWDTQTSNQSSSAGGTGKTTSEMKTLSTFSAWTLKETNNLTTSGEIWGIDDNESINNGYPYLTDGGDTPLPVELLSLTATKSDNVITVSWATASETNNNFFEVQVSEDGYAYSVAGTVSGAGNSNVRRDYEFDYRESNAVEYICLRQVDYNGADELYGPVYVEQNNDKGHNPEVYPNPVESDFYVSFPDPLESETRVRLFNSMGQRIKNVTLQPGNKKTHIQISNDMPAGMYFLKIDGSVNTTQKINIR